MKRAMLGVDLCRAARREPHRGSVHCRWGWALLAACLLMGCQGSSKGTEAELAATLDGETRSAVVSIGQRAVAQDGIVGLAIAVALDGEVVFAKGFGWADAGGTVPVTTNTRFDLGSIGKVFTSAAVMQLVEQGRLSLEDRAQDHLSWIPSHYPEATLEQLLRHTPGFVSAEVDEFDAPQDYFGPRFGAELVTDVELAQGGVRFAAGEAHVYSNPGYLFLGEVVAEVSGMRYDRYVTEYVIAPLGPNGMLVCEAPPEDRVSGHFRRDGDALRVAPGLHMSAWGGSGAVRSGVSDLLRWMIRLDAGGIVSGQSLALMRAPTVLHGTEQAAEIPYGLGMRLGEFRGATRYGHTGTYLSGTAALYSYPEASLQVAVVANTNGPDVPHAHQYEAEVAALLLGLEPEGAAFEPVALTPEERRMIEGDYQDFRVLTATFDGDELVVRSGEEELERVIHVGDWVFRRSGQPDMLQRFHRDGDRAGWWEYSVAGNALEVLRRVPSREGD
ncbi:hypothetical protein ABI59_07570 [Acidobacteria bacterium Mor1]|nr:hypothetical protein ABI59_07570 [Acidobacteria bacterium Mor1]